MAMVDRYKKAGGFIQLLQVIETCGAKKREQLIKVISEETPKWADALNSKMISFERILTWSSEALLEVTAQVNPLALATALKSLSDDEFNKFTDKLGAQEKRKFEQQCKEMNPNPNEISSCIMKVINETRLLFTNGTLKMDKVDPALVIPDNYEILLEQDSKSTSGPSLVVSKSNQNENNPSINSISHSTGIQLGNPNEIDSLRRKIVELNQTIQNLKKENMLMADKLDKIKKIA